jgi:aminoacylase
MWYLEAIRRLQKRGVRLPRTMHVVFVPDEEIGGDHGMLAFIQTPLFKSLRVAFTMDEGLYLNGLID